MNKVILGAGFNLPGGFTKNIQMKKYFYLLQIEEGFEGKAGFILCMPFHIGADYKSLWIALLVQFRENFLTFVFLFKYVRSASAFQGWVKPKISCFGHKKEKKKKVKKENKMQMTSKVKRCEK